MDPQTKDLITLAVALWGSISGTLALLLQFRKFLRDRARLRVEAYFEFPFEPTSTDIKLHVRASNVGRRPISLDSVILQIKAKSWWRTLLWRIRRTGLIALDVGARHSELPEGRGTTLILSRQRLPRNLPLSLIRRILLRDQTGRLWRTAKRLNRRELLAFEGAEKVASDRVSLSGSDRGGECEVYRIGRRFWVLARVRNNNATSFKRWERHSEQEARELMERFVRAAGLFVSRNLEDVDSVFCQVEEG